MQTAHSALPTKTHAEQANKKHQVDLC